MTIGNSPQLFFHVRLKSSMTFGTVKLNLEKLLNCNFSKTDDRDASLDSTSEYKTSCLGLEISLIQDEYDYGDINLFKLIGVVHPKLDFEWEDDFETIDISPYIVGVLNMSTINQWYIPDEKELYE